MIVINLCPNCVKENEAKNNKDLKNLGGSGKQNGVSYFDLLYKWPVTFACCKCKSHWSTMSGFGISAGLYDDEVIAGHRYLMHDGHVQYVEESGAWLKVKPSQESHVRSIILRCDFAALAKKDLTKEEVDNEGHD